MRTHAKYPYKCSGGPFDGGTIYLDAEGDRKTAVFTAAGYRGRYVGDRPTPAPGRKIARNRSALRVVWEPAP